jgi:uncharacterized integral membrane protein
MRFIRLLLAALCVAFGVAVAALNGDPVHLDLLWVELAVPLGLLLLGVLLLGALFGGLAALLSRARPATVAPRSAEDEAAAG